MHSKENKAALQEMPESLACSFGKLLPVVDLVGEILSVIKEKVESSIGRGNRSEVQTDGL